MQNQSNNTNGSLIVRMCNVQKSLIAQEELALMNPGDHVFIVGFDPRSTK